MSFKAQIEAKEQQIRQLTADASAYVKLAEEETRDLTAEESAAVDKITDEQIPALKTEIARLQKLDRIAEENSTVPEQGGLSTGELRSETKKIVVPAVAKRHGKLVAFKGEDADRDAYLSGMFVLATIAGDTHAQQWCRDNGIEIRAALSTTDNSLGGVLVPTPLERSIVDLREQYGVFRRNANVYPMSSDVVIVPRRTGSVTAYFVGENSEITASDAAWDSVEITARKLGVLSRMSAEISADAIISLADWLARDIAWSFAKKEDECGFLGDGTSTYGGITGVKNALAAGSKVTAATGNTAFSTLDLTDFESMVGKLPTYAEMNAKWYISKAGYAASMMRLVDAAGGNNIGNLEGGPGMRQFLGYPVEIVQVMNSTLSAQTSTDGLCYFGDLRMAAILGSRTGVSLRSSEDRYMEYDQIGVKATQRFGINVHERGDATNAGAIIMLSTPGS